MSVGSLGLFVCLLADSLVRWFIGLMVRWPDGSMIRWFVDSFVSSLVRRFVRSFVRSFVSSFICYGLFRRKKYLKIDWSVKMPLYWLVMGVAGS